MATAVCALDQSCVAGFCQSLGLRGGDLGLADLCLGNDVDDDTAATDDLDATESLDALDPVREASGAAANAGIADDSAKPANCKPTGDETCDGKTDEGFADQESDGIADCVDSDVDGVKDVSDNCPKVINQEQQDMDGDGVGDLLLNEKDNCPKLYNTDRKDTDKDGLGNKCDDKDEDLVPWDQDNCPAGSNAKQTDSDSDGRPDKLDCKPLEAANGCESNGEGSRELCDANNGNGSADEGFGVGGECGLGACSGGRVICGSLTKSICSTEFGQRQVRLRDVAP